MADPGVTITDPASPIRGGRAIAAAYVELMKPRIIELLLITTVPSMVLAAGRWPGTWRVVATLIGGTLSAGGANAINNYVDRDIDRLMRRTSQRTLPRHRVEPAAALRFGIVLGLAGFAWLWAATNLLAAALSTAALLFYVLVYTLALKRTTPKNIVIGGAAGAAPTLVGWAAVTGSLSLAAWIMFAIVFYWTPPHFWALSLRYREDYAAAGVPMLPVVAGVTQTTRHILLYTGIVGMVSLALVPVAGLGWLYMLAAVALGAGFVLQAFRVMQDPQRSMRLFTYSNVYLALLFAAVLIDVLVG